MKKALMSVTLFALLVAPAATLADGDVSVNTEVFSRTEYLEDFDFDDTNKDRQDFTFFRARIDVNAQVSEDIGACIEVQADGFWGEHEGSGFFSGDPVGSSDSLDGVDMTLYQAYISLDNIGGSLVSLKVGRQEHILGNELHMGDNDYYVILVSSEKNTRQEFIKICDDYVKPLKERIEKYYLNNLN